MKILNIVPLVFGRIALILSLVPGAKKSFRKAQLDYFDSKRAYAEPDLSCLETELTCSESEYPNRDCPESKLACDKFDFLKSKTHGLDCPRYKPALPCPKYVECREARTKHLDAVSEALQVCFFKSKADYDSSVCWETRLREVTLNISYAELEKSRFESEAKDANLS
jgi:hypothetical protein